MAPITLMKMNGTDLLTEFRRNRSGDAFATLVYQYANLVFSVARRRLGDPELAEDAAQSVFTRLALTPPNVASDAELIGWLHQTTLHVSIDLWRSETRRRIREQHAAADMDPASVPEDPSLWREIAPHLDEAIQQLGPADREAILVRFFGQKSMRELGRALGISEAAAKMRVGRALEKLRIKLARHGVACSIGSLGTLLVSRAVEAAPLGLAHHWAALPLTAALPATAIGTAPVFWGVPKLILAMSKPKIAIVLLGIATASLIVSHQLTLPPDFDVNGDVDGAETMDRALRAAGQRPLSIFERFAPAQPVSSSLEEAKRALRALLQNPPSARVQPAPEMVQALARFGEQLSEAIPILLEAAGTPDYETRSWALSGLSRTLAILREGELREGDAEVLSRVWPVLTELLLDAGAPEVLRLMALMEFLPPPWSLGSGANGWTGQTPRAREIHPETFGG